MVYPVGYFVPLAILHRDGLAVEAHGLCGGKKCR
jgi:hypothetical protein